MANFPELRREGVTNSSNLPHVLHVLLKKTLPQNNIVVGLDVPQLQFIQRYLKTIAKPVERVTDDMLAGYDGRLYHVTFSHKVDLSPEFRQRTGIWALSPITKGSSAIHTLVKFAASLIDIPENSLKHETIDRVAEELLEGEIFDIYTLMWKAAWILSGGLAPVAVWKEPWESPTEWLTLDMNPSLRLNVLYKKLVGYVYLTVYSGDAATKYGLTPSQQNHFKQINLDLKRVYRSISVLSRWKQGRRDAYVCALEISSIWS